MDCINKAHAEYKNLLNNSGLSEDLLDARIMVWQERNGLDNFPTLDEVKYPNANVNYKFKVVEALGKISRNKYESNKLQGWINDLQKYGVPTSQLEMFKNSAKEGMTKDEIITSILADYSYAIKINTTKGTKKWTPIGEPNPDEAPEDYILNIENATENSQYYSRLTVPGGTNYAENEISIPLITPSLKGHAQFSTDQGIGWFRSDDERSHEFKEDVDQFQRAFGLDKDTKKATKTRRILEVQSDLFQKGRDKKDLIAKPTILEYQEDAEKANLYDVAERENWTQEKFDEEFAKIDKKIKSSITTNPQQNQFLQLLNKDNNWVTFFVKSIVQDSVKKGYKKVLFPKGETAARIEGHQVIADRIIAIDKQIQELKIGRTYYTNDAVYFRKDGKFFAEDLDGVVHEISQNTFNKAKTQDATYSVESEKKEIEILEQEKQRYKSEGIEKLAPIEAFYEKTITNILNKLYGSSNIKVVTDEYGNQWNELTVDIKRDITPISLQLQLVEEGNLEPRKLDERYREAFKVFADQINKTLPVNVLITDLPQRQIAYQQSDNIYVDINKINSATLMHEVQHIWNKILQHDNAKLWQEMKVNAKKLIDANDPIVQAIRNRYEELNGKLSENDLIHEVLATVSGLESQDILRKFFIDNGMIDFANDTLLQDNAIKIYKPLVTKVWDAIRSFFKRMGFINDKSLSPKAKLSTIFREQAYKMLNTPSQSILEDDRDHIRTLLGYSISKQEDLSSDVKTINTLKDFVPILNANTNSLQAFSSIDFNNPTQVQKYAEDLYSMGRTNKKNKDQMILNFTGQEYIVSNSINDKVKVLELIKNKIIPEIIEYKNLFTDKIINFVKLVTQQEMSLTDAALQVFPNKNGQSYYSPETLSKIMFHFGGVTSNYGIYKYSELKTRTEPSLKNLYREEFVGYDPIVIVHAIDINGVPDISIIDVPTAPMLDRTNTKNRLTGNKRDTYSNSEADIRKASVGITMMNMKQNMKEINSDVRFRRLGVLRVTSRGAEGTFITDIKEALNNIRSLQKLNISSDKIRETLNNEDLYDDESYAQSFSAIFACMLDDMNKREPAKWYLRKQYNELTRPGVTKEEQLRVYERMQIDMLRNDRSGDVESVKRKPEYMMLARAIMELKTGRTQFMNRIKEIGRIEAKLTTGWNWESDIIQWTRTALIETQTGIKNDWNAYKKRMIGYGRDKKLLRTVTSEREGVIGKVEGLLVDMGSQVYKSMYKTIDVNGEKFILPYLHWDRLDAETQTALKNKTISENDIVLANQILDLIKEQHFKNYYHSKIQGYAIENTNVLGEVTLTKEQAMKEFERDFPEEDYRGWVPVMSQSVYELLVKREFKSAYQLLKNQLENDENIFIDDQVVIGNPALTEIENHFRDIHDIGSLLRKVGLKAIGNGKYEVTSIELNKKMSTNIEKNLNYYMMSSIRKIRYEKDFLPVARSAEGVFNMLESHGKDLTNVRDSWKQIIELNAYNKNRDTKLDPNQKISSKARAFKNFSSMIAVGGKPLVAFKSFAANMKNYIFSDLANDLSNIGIDKDSENYNKLSVKDNARKAINWVTTHPKLAAILAYQMNVIGTSERDLLSDPEMSALGYRGTITQKYLLQNDILQVMNKFTDVAGRAAVVVQLMMNEGSFKAISYDEQEGEFVYDVKKDRRFYDEDGKEKTANGEHSIRQLIYDNNIKEGLQVEGEPMKWGWDAKLTSDMKWYGDKFVVGSFSKDVRALLGNDFAGDLLTQFRLFQVDKLQNMGLFLSTRNTEFGGGYKAIQITNEKGEKEWVSKKEILEIEGTWQSWSALFRDLRTMKDFASVKDWWKVQASPLRRKNIAMSLTTVTFIMTAVAAIKGLLDDDDEKKVFANVKWLLSDLIIATAATDWIKNPIPAINIYSQLFNMVFDAKERESIINFAGPTKSIQQMWNYSLSTDTKRKREYEKKQELKQERRENKLERQEEIENDFHLL